MAGEARDPRVELGVGEAAFAGEIDHGHPVRRAPAEMGDPVVVANCQMVLRDGGYCHPAPCAGLLSDHHAQLRPPPPVGLLVMMIALPLCGTSVATGRKLEGRVAA